MRTQDEVRSSLQDAVRATESFFKPALEDRDSGEYITRKLLANKSDTNQDDDGRACLLQRAGMLLQQIDQAVESDRNSSSDNQTYDSTLLLAVYKLLDYIVLEGIYPSVPPGLGALQERRSKSLFYRKPDPHYFAFKGSNQLQPVLHNSVEPILHHVDQGIEPMLRHRCLADLIVAYISFAREQGSSEVPYTFKRYLDR